jgi:transcriptional regulator with XRE-family HTH domain
MFGNGRIDSDRLSIAMRERGVSQAGLAKAVNVSPAAIQQLLNGKTARSRYLGDIARFLEVSPEWVLGLSDEKEGRPVEQLLDFVEPVLMYDLQHLLSSDDNVGTMRYLDRRMFPIDIRSDKEGMSLVLVSKLGSDMAPTLWHEDLILIDQSAEQFDVQDKIWAVAVGGIPMIRRWRGLGGDRAELLADNSQAPSMQISVRDVELIGRVIWQATPYP